MPVGFAEGLGAAKTYATRDGYQVDADRELIGLGAANLASGLSSGMVVNGSLSKTAVNGSAGARTQASGLVVAVLTVITLLFLTGLFEDLPEAALAAVVIAALIELVDYKALAALWRAYSSRLGKIYGFAARADFIAAVAAMLGVLIFDTLPGLLIGVLDSVLLLIYRVARPHVAVLGEIPGSGGQWADIAVHPEDQTVPGITVLRVEAGLFFGNADHVHDAIADAAAADGTRAIVLDCQTTPSVDVTAARDAEPARRRPGQAGSAAGAGRGDRGDRGDRAGPRHARRRRRPRPGTGIPPHRGRSRHRGPDRAGHQASRGGMMGQAIGGALPLAVGIALSPIPIIAVVLVRASERAKVNGPVFVLGWLTGLGIVGAIVLAIAGLGRASQSGSPAAWVSWVKIVLGVLLLRVAARQFRGRPRGDEEPTMPKWMATIDKTRPAAAFGLAAVLSGANPKNLPLAVGGAAAIAGTGISGGEQAIAYLVFALIGTLGVGIPVVIYFAMGERSQKLLAGLKDWMSAHNAVIMTVLCLVIAAKLIGDGISGLTG
jgi:hypothetical protein